MQCFECGDVFFFFDLSIIWFIFVHIILDEVRYVSLLHVLIQFCFGHLVSIMDRFIVGSMIFAGWFCVCLI